jgi:ferritin-like protein
MEATAPGQNRTGAAVNPKDIDLMLEAVRVLSPPKPISTLQMDVERQDYIADADSIGSIPPQKTPRSAQSKKSAGKASKASDVSTAVLLDKLGERIAFERTGTRLYGALITKHTAVLNAGEEGLPPASGDEAAEETLRRIRDEELRHFHLLCQAVKNMGGDPTAQTPSADVTAAASMGLMQVMTDPSTTLAQCLNTILTAELTDNAGWEMLIELAEEAGQNAMTEAFSQALRDEQQHLVIVRGWLEALLISEAGTPAV